MDPARKSLEDILFEDKILSSDQLSQVKLEKVTSGKDAAEIVLFHGFASKSQILKAKAKLLGVGYVDITTLAIAPEPLGLVPQAVATQYLCVPFEYDEASQTLSVAMANPLDLVAVGFLERKTGKKIKPFLADEAVIPAAIADYYSQSLTSQVTAVLSESGREAQKQAAEAAKKELAGEGVLRDAPVAKAVASVLEFAVKARASDVHIEALEGKTRIRYRIDGILQEKLILPSKIHDSLVSRVKILAELKIDEKRIPQDGRFNYKSSDHEVDIRVSTLPTAFGEKVVMRLLKKSGPVPSLPDLGLRGNALKHLEATMLRPHGLIVVCGPTGSGKTTTLFAVLSRINSTRVNIVTIEDPVEYQIPGVNQVQINPLAGLTFASALRSFLRQDPNIILVGEIRDSETVDLAIQAALTGHLVFSTVHTNSAAGAIPRFLDLGAESFLLSSSLNCVVGQRITRKLCDHCKEPYAPPEIIFDDFIAVLADLFPKEARANFRLFRSRGCDQCGDTGYFGRIGIFEVLPVSEKIAKLVLARSDTDSLSKQAVSEGMITMKQDGYLKALEGVTSMEEVLRVAQD